MSYTNRRNGYFESCVQAVSESPYGRDAREPIAEALNQIRTGNTTSIALDAEYAASTAAKILDEVTENMENKKRSIDGIYGVNAREPIEEAKEIHDEVVDEFNRKPIRTRTKIRQKAEEVLPQLEAIRVNAERKCSALIEPLDKAYEILQTALGSVTLSPIPDMEDDYRLSIQRIDGQ